MKQTYESIEIRGQHLLLTAQRSIFWEEESALIVSDLHLGKTGHFRKAGIAVPASVYKEDLQRLVSQIQYFQSRRLIVVGDMFHSSANKELELFARWRRDFSDLRIELVKGNHDILPQDWYRKNFIDLHEPVLTQSVFCFQHDPGACQQHAESPAPYVFSGHLHPGITVQGMGRQSLRFPCFYFTDHYCVLPAFSRFTGTVSIRPSDGETAFAIVNDSIIKMAS